MKMPGRRRDMFSGMIEKRIAYSLQETDTIWIRGCSQDIRFLHGSTQGELEIREIMWADASGIQAEHRGSALCLYADRDKNTFFHRGHLAITESQQIELKLPEEFQGQIYAETFSGDVYLIGFWDIKNLQMKTKSGDISIGCVRAEHVLVESISGDIDVEQAVGDLQLYSTSGDIYLKDGKGKLHGETVSGDINAAGLVAKTILASKSGDIEVDFVKITDAIEMRSVSGDVEVTVARNNSYNVVANAVSGSVNVYLDAADMVSNSGHSYQARVGQNVTDNSPMVQISTVSGDIDVANRC